MISIKFIEILLRSYKMLKQVTPYLKKKICNMGINNLKTAHCVYYFNKKYFCLIMVIKK